MHCSYFRQEHGENQSADSTTTAKENQKIISYIFCGKYHMINRLKQARNIAMSYMYMHHFCYVQIKYFSDIFS